MFSSSFNSDSDLRPTGIAVFQGNSSSDSDLLPTGIGAFQGDSFHENQSQIHSNTSGSGTKDSPTASFAVDILEFLEFLSKNSVKIIPREEFTLESTLDDTANTLNESNSDDRRTHATSRPTQLSTVNQTAAELKGANMQVLRASWNGEPVALKVFKATPTPNFGSTASDFAHKFREYTNLMQDIRYEIQVMNQWSGNQHRNIVHLLGLSFEEGIATTEPENKQDTVYIERYLRPILVNPLAHKSYPDLRYYLQHPDRPRPLPYDECVRLIGDIADGVHGLHHAGIIHADLKPENILIFPTGQQRGYEGDLLAKVADFGFSGLKVNDLLPRGGTRQWNAPECLRSCVDEELFRYSGEATRDIYSFGLVMVHIMLDGEEPLPFHDPEALDELKLQDKAREEALTRLRSYYFRYRSNAEPYELERLEKVVRETLQLVPAERCKKLDGVRSCLVGQVVYPRELEIIRMTVGHRYPALVAMNHTDPLYQAAAVVPAVQAASKKLPFSLRASIFQHYLSHNMAEVPWTTKMRLLGLATQEIRETLARNTKATKKGHYRFPLNEMYHNTTSNTKKSPAEIQILQQIESQLLKEYTEYRNPERRIRGYLEGIFEDFRELQGDNSDSSKLRFLCDIKLGLALDSYFTGEILPKPFLSSKTKGGLGPLHCAAYYDRHYIIRRLLCLGVQVDDRVGVAGYTALHIAAIKGNTTSIQALLEGKADPNCYSWGELGCGFTPLGLVVLWCYNPEGVLEAIKVLASYGADFTKTMGGRVSLAHMAAGRTTSEVLRIILSHAPALLDARDVYHRTPLHVAAEEGRLENVKLLLDLGAKLRLRDYENKTPLDLAANPKMGGDNKGLVTGIYSDFAYRILRSACPEVSADESSMVIHHIKKAIETIEDPEATQKDPQNLEVPTGYKKNEPATFPTSHEYRITQPAAQRSYNLRFAVADAVSIPRSDLKLHLSDALPLKSKDGWHRERHYVVFEPRYGLRIIYNVIKDVPPLDYQLVLRLCRIKHEWNDFPMMLQVFKLPKRVCLSYSISHFWGVGNLTLKFNDGSQEILFSHLWQPSHCLPLENTIYTVKFGEFQLLEATDIEISLSTVEIGSSASPSAGLAFNWIEIEPSVPEVPVYGILDRTDAHAQMGLESSLKYVSTQLDVEPVEYDVRDESNYDELSRTNYY